MAHLPYTTALFVPADRPDRFAKALGSGADLVIIDLEDAVAPDRKAEVRHALVGVDLDWRRIAVRVNAYRTPWHADDLAALRGLPLAALMLPKAEIQGLTAVASEGVPLLPLIETALGIAQARALAQAPGVFALAFGNLDYSYDLGCENEPQSLLLARSELVLASRLAGLSPPLDGVTTQFNDPDLVERDARAAKALGFGGKLLIHPQQIAPTRAAFSPSEKELAWARAVLGEGGSGGVGASGGEMVDRPVRLRAEALLAHAARGRNV